MHEHWCVAGHGMHASACARKRGRPAADGSHGSMSTALPPTPRTPCSAALGVHYAATASAPPPPSPPHVAGASCKARTASWVGCAREAHLQWRACVGGLCRAASIAAEALAHLIIFCVQHKPAAIPNILKHLHRYVCVPGAHARGGNPNCVGPPAAIASAAQHGGRVPANMAERRAEAACHQLALRLDMDNRGG